MKLVSMKQVKEYLKENHDKMRVSGDAQEELNKAVARLLDNLAEKTKSKKKKTLSKEIIEEATAPQEESSEPSAE